MFILFTALILLQCTSGQNRHSTIVMFPFLIIYIIKGQVRFLFIVETLFNLENVPVINKGH